MHPAKVCVPFGTTCAAAIARMTEEKQPCCIVIDGYGKIAGLVRTQDILEKILFKLGPQTLIEDVMDDKALTVFEGEYLYHAIARMRRRHVDEIIVVDQAKQPLGIISYREAVEAAASRLIQHIDRLGGEGNLDSLRGVKAAQVEIARDLFDDNVSAAYIQHLLSHVNNDIVARIITMNLAHMEAEGWGTPPVEFCVIVMGSGGRGENYLSPDQDNGFILDNYPDEDHGRVDQFFRELAARMCNDLNEIGFPYCKGYVMASNPLWRKSLSQWVEQVRLWGRKRNAAALRLADIFFDFQPVWGRLDLAHDLRQNVLKMVRENNFFLQEMYRAQADHSVGLGLFGRLAPDPDVQSQHKMIDLKYRGSLPLVEGIRLLSLRHALEVTSTEDRIEKLHNAGVLSDTEADYLGSAFAFLVHILLKRQVMDYRNGVLASRFVRFKDLSKRERENLRNALRHIEAFRKRLKAEFTGDVF
ncbi:hypothetical protein GCM10011332_17330 [Terasakiella brassicae]|uniref:CBS domain-containing protein n=2 Tax=Terasakiella brassicae TaxID=1634917 RepID=A0A917BZX6_9PROT|nr:hypothetical protein GCM10011332_17330 [Terasakiella brassicae]